jgi:hypothetical protein
MGDNLRAERVVERLQSFLLQVEISEIIVHEGDEPNAFVDFLDSRQTSVMASPSRRRATKRRARN